MPYKPGEISKFDDLSLPPWERGVRQGGTFNKQTMIENVHIFREVMYGHGVCFSLMFGTLLGAIRDKDIIEGDSDFDVFCFNKDKLDWYKAKKDLRNLGFYIPDEVPPNDDFIIRNGEKIDINWVMPFGKFYVYNPGIYYPKEYFDTLVNINFLETVFLIPLKAEQLLTDLYGNWRVKSKQKGRINIYPK